MQINRRMIRVTSAGLLLGAFISGCGRSAIIERTNAPAIEGKIVGNDSEYLHVEVDRSGRPMMIPHKEVSDIDHPGNVAAIIGTIVSVYGMANIAVGVNQCEANGPAFCTGVFLPAAIGLPLMIYGVSVWASSVSAADGKASKPQEASISVVPLASLKKSEEFGGVGVSVAF